MNLKKQDLPATDNNDKTNMNDVIVN